MFLTFGCVNKDSSKNDNNNNNNKGFVNDLIYETSPYLLQHAYNPVDWKAWNSETLELAKKSEKLIIISVGYSACHWCHVMEEESFENDSVAKLMNANFISIKVDREERPDVDQIYMNAVQLMTGSGGWPLNCITLPDGRPIFGGTYFTKEQWIKALTDISNMYRNDPQKVIDYAEKLTHGIKTSELVALNTQEVQFTTKKLDPVIASWKLNLDFEYGGQASAPKFPMPNNLNLLLRHSVQNDDTELQGFVMNSLTKMTDGGLYDQIGGGFSRYSVDEKWHIPHFEKMLYDNAQLVSLYSDAYLISKDEHYKTIVEQTLDFVKRELTDASGGFYASLDADSEDRNGNLKEGTYYSWTEKELKSILQSDFEIFKNYYNINSIGKWEDGGYILIKTKTDEEFVNQHNLKKAELRTLISKWNSKLFKIRDARKKPRIDDKILTSWNALMLKGYVDAYRVFGTQEYLDIALKNAQFIKTNQFKNDGGLFHSHKDGKATIEGFSEDYAMVIEGFISLYEVTLDDQWLQTANELTAYTINHFLDEKSKMFFFTSNLETNLITRKMEVIDGVIPSSNSIMAENLFKLSHYYSDETYSKLAKQMLNNVHSDMMASPSGYSNWLSLYLNYSNPYYEVAISGKEAQQKLKELNSNYLPNILIAGSTNESDLSLLENRYVDDETYFYICVNSTCNLPTTQVEKAFKQMKFK
ncbi:thioredoxin domain-containing protein [Gelidibacter salicanalis]|uniref:Thioredoxin domain-containing protein n=1 Tax=Gelidibacter salicanalis TaxID=291193 RepID=A0A934KJI8_9FLAO|nr:thioredoxin domain-containing protein [Gelidibacter salicanalis]